MTTYSIYRLFQTQKRKLIKSGQTLEEAQTHCKDPESSSLTCTSRKARQRTQKHNLWFDTYEAEK